MITIGWTEWDLEAGRVYADGKPLPALEVMTNYLDPNDPRMVDLPCCCAVIPLENGLYVQFHAEKFKNTTEMTLILLSESDFDNSDYHEVWVSPAGNGKVKIIEDDYVEKVRADPESYEDIRKCLAEWSNLQLVKE